MLEETGLPYEPHLVRFDQKDQLSPEFRSLNPNDKIPAIIDPHGPGRRAAGAVRIGRDPDLPRRQERPVPAAERRGALRDAAVADVPDGRHRPDVRPGRLLPQVRRQGLRGQAAARSLRRRSRGACSTCSTGGSRARTWIMGDDYTIADIATFPMDPQPDRASTARASWSASTNSPTSARARGVRRAARGCAGGEHSVADHKQLSSPTTVSNTREHQEHCPQTACASFVCSRLTSPATQRAPRSRARCAKLLATGGLRR